MAVLKKRNLIIIAVIMLVIAIVLSSFVYLNSQKPYTGKMESISVAYSPFESVTLFWVAEQQHFFSQNGVNVTSREYSTGAGALDGVLKGEADIVVGTAEFPLPLGYLIKQELAQLAVSLSLSSPTWLDGQTGELTRFRT